MTSHKRKEVEGEPNGSKTVKKLKQDDDNDSQPLTLQSKANNFQGADDGTMELLFSDLYYSINTFAGKYFIGNPYVYPRKNKDKTFFESLTGNCGTYLTSKIEDAKETIIQAAIWNKLINSLLEQPLKAFLQMPEAIIKNDISDDEEFYAWRTLTANMLLTQYKGRTSWVKGGPRRQEWVKEMATILLDLSVVNQRATLESRLDEIADHAIKLATAMACSRAGWICTMKDPRIKEKELSGFRIKTDRMEDVDLWDEDEGHGKSMVVDLVKTPMLLKCGNSNGENYDQCRVVSMAKVVVKKRKQTTN